jgi:outer membrane protein insertion porin family
VVLMLCVLSPRLDAQQEHAFPPRGRLVPLRLDLQGIRRLDREHMAPSLPRSVTVHASPLQDDSALRTTLIDAAAAQGFPFMHIDSIAWNWSNDSSAATVSVWITEGPRLRVGRVLFPGLRGLSPDVLHREMEMRPGAMFRDELLERDLRRIVAILDAAGYPFAEARVADITLRRDTAADQSDTGAVTGGAREDGDALADVEIRISEGPLFYIDELTVEGNALTNADVIVRETRLGPHARYDPEEIGEIRRRVERLQFFSRVDEPALYMRDSTGGLLLRVVEGNTNQFDGVVGYQPPRGDEERGSVTGLVNLQLRNLFGTGRRLAARWERATTEISELDFQYLEPWLAGLPVNIEAAFFQRQQDSAYVRRSLDGAITFLWSSALQLTASVQQVTVIPAEGNDILARGTTLAGGLALRIDTRDDVYNPRAGITLRNSYSAGNKRATSATGTVRSAMQRLELDAEYYLELLPRTVLATALHGRELRGGDLDLSDLYRLGGATTLRGYREEQFSGTRLGWTTVELRYSLGRRTFGFAFFDFGYIEQSPDPARNRDGFSVLRGGYGIGGRLETGLGILGVSYALGEGDSLAEGKIHFGLINAF